jgi:hypothetical protein
MLFAVGDADKRHDSSRRFLVIHCPLPHRRVVAMLQGAKGLEIRKACAQNVDWLANVSVERRDKSRPQYLNINSSNFSINLLAWRATPDCSTNYLSRCALEPDYLSLYCDRCRQAASVQGSASAHLAVERWMWTKTNQALAASLCSSSAIMGRTGSMHVTVVPWPSRLKMRKVPPWSSTRARLMASPSPLP